MHAAAQGGHLEVLKFLSPMFGARVHEKDRYGYSILHQAVWNGHSQVARYLIEELKLDPKDQNKVCTWGAGVEELYAMHSIYASANSSNSGQCDMLTRALFVFLHFCMSQQCCV